MPAAKAGKSGLSSGDGPADVARRREIARYWRRTNARMSASTMAATISIHRCGMVNIPHCYMPRRRRTGIAVDQKGGNGAYVRAAIPAGGPER